MFVIVSYDISDDKERKKVHNILKDFGTRVQYSVFECVINIKQLKELKEKTDIYATGSEDSIRYYLISDTSKLKLKITGKEKKVVHGKVYII